MMTWNEIEYLRQDWKLDLYFLAEDYNLGCISVVGVYFSLEGGDCWIVRSDKLSGLTLTQLKACKYQLDEGLSCVVYEV